MKIYKSINENNISTYYDSYTDVLEEFKAFLDFSEVGNKVKYEIIEMTEEEFKTWYSPEISI